MGQRVKGIITTINPFWEEIQSYGDSIPWLDGRHDLRGSCCHTYAWAIPDPASLAFVAQWLGPQAVEMGAGTGYWAWQLSQLGVDMRCYDQCPPDRNYLNHWHSPMDVQDGHFLLIPRKTYFPVQEGEPEVLAQHRERTLFLCWPPYDDPMGEDALRAYPGKRLVYIGEGGGGCNANDAFFSLLYDEWKRIASHGIVEWQSIHDHITVYERREYSSSGPTCLS